ncbi:3-oxoacyl-ACP synthase III family protein [Williamwhitmania taraxaci]|uniref:3-oxoacyl-[acyl-carrier-protein] synthase-3 n=1 Tax=Williamwhitmania taraxaci TaxID=1640674 RepID=A0A1G6NVD1_9BACT|nr:ketoacyl-ACP synthase III [Williamwhitmania taraxaci]SDC71980.1 3-oxoacyl-[acyl-carrier-protein] synthase-3 [Williamwhitmania taraxaci]
MSYPVYSTIAASGRYIPTQVVKNENFLNNEFFNASGVRIEKSNQEVIEKFHQITEISERRYVTDDLKASDIAFLAAKDALTTSGIDMETLDYIIVAHNFGDVSKENRRTDIVPSLASRVKRMLGIVNPFTVAYDLPFGCPGWIQAVIQADYYIRSGDAKRVLVIGAETLSRIADPHDIDCMIYSDGAGAVVLEALESPTPVGIITHLTRSDTLDHGQLLTMDLSYNPEYGSDDLFLKMNGRKLYEYALNHVPQLVKQCIDKAGINISDIGKVLIHQANAKMDDAILARLLKLYGVKEVPADIMPMTISTLGNNSVATIPILYDMIAKGKMENQQFKKDEYLVFASVGAGMNINAFVYKTV